MPLPAAAIGNPSAEAALARAIEYLSPPAAVSMADRWFEIASLDHFWVRRRFEVLQRLAGAQLPAAKNMAEIGCGHGLLQRQVEDQFGKPVTGFDLNDFALKQNISRTSQVCCYDIFQREPALRQRFDLIFLFDVLEHLSDEQKFLDAVTFHLAPQGRLILNVPAGQWAFSAYDVAAGHQRRYSMNPSPPRPLAIICSSKAAPIGASLLSPRSPSANSGCSVKRISPQIISEGFDARTSALNAALGFLSRCEPLPQKFLGTSLMATFRPALPTE